MGSVEIASSNIRNSQPPSGTDPQIFNEVKKNIIDAMMYANIIGVICCLAFSLFFFPWGILCGLM